jgi:hypothetical protein
MILRELTLNGNRVHLGAVSRFYKFTASFLSSLSEASC